MMFPLVSITRYYYLTTRLRYMHIAYKKDVIIIQMDETIT